MPTLKVAIEEFRQVGGGDARAFVLDGKFGTPAVLAHVGTPYVLAKPCDLDRLLETTRRALRETTAPHPAQGKREKIR